MITKKSKGFTIIELLVVVAIIAVLAAIVLVNVTQYIAKGKNASIKGNMSTIRTNAAVWYDGQSPSTYVGFAANSTYANPAAAITANGGTPIEVETASKFCACTTMNVTNTEPTNSTFCVDSAGYAKVTQNAGLCATRCPAAAACID
ncbi:MAG: hypothetical protein A3F47_00960 [Candidatus Staskawiczbacteria bacterium RIFCSPHIGHO2_12_FULL_38_11]|uniref:Prepilin-type N-terminal cleavage/methylation domain-containing protein n=1 Tax=Candidatus Staskawiczbacteria bacterium RIFCSPHIGHO2_12_FULL_38_11 TaxID=1802209 RepID=A0A1G2I438_9BACT|nr:MAG: hypothetical protein A3F47_00960 [Candidatus Staskawiczbacteria bacterium RIFCSPHIGHO2_12_FULL_38_11]